MTRHLPLALLLLPAPAFAVDLQQLIEAWTVEVEGQDGSDGVGEAHDVKWTKWGEILVGGYVDGAVNHGKDGKVISFDPYSGDQKDRLPPIIWELTIDAGDETSKTLSSSDDRVYAVDIEPISNILVTCGQSAIDGGGTDPDVETWFTIDRYDPLTKGQKSPPSLLWTEPARDANGEKSPNNACADLFYQNDIISATGWSSNNDPDIQGRWITRVQGDGPTAPLLSRPVLRYDSEGVIEPSLAAADRAYGVARNTNNDLLAIVGTREFSGLEGELTNNTDWHVIVSEVVFDAQDNRELYTELWQHSIRINSPDGLPQDEGLEDAALAAAFDPDPLRPHLVVAGYINRGDDNFDKSDRDWKVISYQERGEDGFVQINWDASFGSSGADEVATSVVYDDQGNLLVAGSGSDKTSGNEIFRIAQYEHTEPNIVAGKVWEGPDHGGDSRVLAFDVQPERVVLAGYVDDGTGRDFAMTLIDLDDDDDDFANANDFCPEDRTKAIDGGICGCNSPDDDFDGDGTANCNDGCSTDPNKVEPEVCGCENPETDGDGDGTLDCVDECPTDSDKSELGICGCLQPDSDEDGDGLVICQDACLDTPEGAEVDQFGCSDFVPDTGTGNGDGGGGGGGEGCGCTATPSPMGAAAVLLPLLIVLGAVRRRDSLGSSGASALGRPRF